MFHSPSFQENIIFGCRKASRLSIAISLLLFMASLMFACAVPGQAQNPGGVTLSVQAGFDSYCKENHWLPVQVLVENTGNGFEGVIEALVPTVGGQPAAFTQPISLPANARKAVTLVIHAGNYLDEIKVSLLSGNRLVAQKAAPLSCLGAGDTLVGILSSDTAAFSSLANSASPPQTASLARLYLNDLPLYSQALEPLDILLISGTDTGQLTASQLTALTEWVTGGGTLILTGGPGWQQSTAGLANLLPLDPAGTTTIPSLNALANYINAPDSLNQPAVIAAGKPLPGAQVIISAGTFPLLISRAAGRGRVLLLTADPAVEPLKSWDKLNIFYWKLLSGHVYGPEWAEGVTNWNSANEALSFFPGLYRPYAPLMLGFLCVYIAAVGPLNFILLKKYKKLEWAWVTLPALIIVFSLGAFIVGNNMRGSKPVLNQLSLVQAWPEAKTARVDILVGIYSPRRASYDLLLPPQVLAFPVPGYSNLAPANGWRFQQEPASVPGIKIDVASVKGLAVQGYLTATPITHTLQIKFGSAGATLEGEIINSSDLKLEDAVLLVSNGVYHLGTLAAHERRPIQLVPDFSGRASLAGLQMAPASIQSALSLSGLSTPNTLGELLFTSTPFSYEQNPMLNSRRLFANAVSDDSLAPLPGRGSSIYLLGWSSQPPFTLELTNQSPGLQAASLYITRLDAGIATSRYPLKLDPFFFTWRVIEADTRNARNNAAAYDTMIYDGSFSLWYCLAGNIPFRTVSRLTLHLESYGMSGPSNVDISLWDYTQQAWGAVPEPSWGDNPILQPERFVTPNGEIRVKVENQQSATIALEKLDFTLEVLP